MAEFPLAESASSSMLATCHSVTAYHDTWIEASQHLIGDFFFFFFYKDKP